MPVLAFLTLLTIKDYLEKSRLLIAFGKMSMQIYLYHVIIFNALLLVVKRFHCPPTIADGVVVLLVTLVVSYVLASLTTRVPWIKRLLYPEVKKR
jgi:peptidoglycan/LPS O-acetylase OafA/YrhL